MKPTILVISGAGGAGKTTIRTKLLKALPNELVAIQKVTTRPKRPGEGDEFIFVSREQFEAMRRAGEFFEETEFGGNWYGTPKAPLEQALAAGKSIVMTYDAAGCRNIRRRYPQNSFWVFLQVPEATLRRRLKARGESDQKIDERIRLAPIAEYPQPGEADLEIDNSDGQVDHVVTTIVNALKNR